MSNIKIIKKIEELDSIEPLLRIIQNQLDTYGSYSEYNKVKNALINALKSESRALFFLWYSDDNKLGAFVFANVCSGLDSGADYFWLNELYVDEVYRKKGVATELLKFIDLYAKENSIYYISCSTWNGNTNALKLYNKNNFKSEPVIWIDKRVD